MADLVEFVPAEASPEEWGRYHVFRRRQKQEWHTDEPLAPDEVVEHLQKRPDPRQRHHRYHVVEGGEVVGEMDAETTRPESPEYETNRHLLWASGYVLRSHRRRGIALSWVPEVLTLMEELGATVLTGEAEDDTGHGFMRRLGAEPKLAERASRLTFREVDWDMLHRWVREAGTASPGVRLDLYPTWVTDDVLDEYCVALNELLNTMPFEGLDHGDIVMTPESVREWRGRMQAIGAVNPTCMVREADGSISGMTDVLKRPHEPGIVRQMFTGVHPRARGRGLGKWLKAAMLLHVREAFPDTLWISTENAGSNAPMLAINTALGFRLHMSRTFYQVERETLRRAASA